MMSLGSIGGGGAPSSSPSSSNLSALAPPFTVDRSNSKPNSNPLLQFSELPYASSFGHTWQYANPTASRLDTFQKSELEADSTNVAAPMASTNDYNFQYSVPQCNNNNNTQSNTWSPLNPTAKTSADPFLFDPKVGTYYPPYISPVTDEGNPLVSLSDSGYDLLPSSGAQVDYTQCLSGLEYTPSWGGGRYELVDAKRGKHAKLDGGFVREMSNASHSDAYTNYLNQGSNMVDCENIPEEASGSSCRQFSDVIGRETSKHSLMMEDMDNISFLAQKVISLPFDASTTSIPDSCFTISESPAAGPCLQTPKTSSSCQNPYISYGKGSQPISSCFSTSISVTKSSPTLVLRPPPVGTGWASQKSTSHKTVDVVDSAPAHQNKGLGNNKSPSRGKEPQILQNSEGVEGSFWTSKLKNHEDETDKMFSLSSSVVERSPSKVQNKDALRMNHGSQFLNVNTLDGCSFSDESILAIKSENFVDCLDHHNPAVDSPCWKGAPTSPFTTFDAVDTASSHPFMKKIDECLRLDSQIHPIFPSLHDPIRPPSEKEGKDKVYLEHESAATEHVSVGLTKVIPIPTSIEGVQFCKKSSEAGEKYDSPNPLKSDSLLTVSGNNNLGGGGYNFATKKPNLQAMDTMITINDTTEGGAVAVRAAEDVLCSPSSEESDSEQVKPHKSVANPKMDVQTLISAMQNLSDLLVFSCCSNVCALKEQDHEALKHVIHNLDSLLSQRMVYMTQQKGPLLPQLDNSEKVVEYIRPPKSVDAGKPQFENKAYLKLNGQVDHPQCSEERKAASFQHSSSLTHDLDCLDDDNISKAIRKVLEENSYFGEEEHSQALLFKSLWLDAEAKLCSISYRARFDRMKIKLERLKCTQTKENIAVPQKCWRYENSQARNTSILSPLDVENVKSVLTPKTSTQSSSSKADGVEASVKDRLHVLTCRDDLKPFNLVQQPGDDDVEASVMTRFQILKRRDDANPVTPVEQQVDIVQPVQSDDSVSQSPGNSGKRNQFSAASTDNSSDWEHVLKENFSWR